MNLWHSERELWHRSLSHVDIDIRDRQEITEDVSWPRLLEVLKIEYRQRSTGVIYSRCVFHGDRTPSLVMRPSGSFCCYGCHKEGDMVDFMYHYEFKTRPSYPEDIVEFYRNFPLLPILNQSGLAGF